MNDKNKSEITVGIKLTIAPMQFNSITTWAEKKVIQDENMSDQEFDRKVNEARKKVMELSFNESIDCIEKYNIPLNQANLLSHIKINYQDVNQQEINVDYTEVNNSQNLNNNPKEPNMIMPDVLQPSSIDSNLAQSFQGLFNGLNSLSENEKDSSDDIDSGIIEGSLHGKNG